jgi:hypothetical protein
LLLPCSFLCAGLAMISEAMHPMSSRIAKRNMVI